MANIDTLKTLLQITDTSIDTQLETILNLCEAEYLRRTHQTDADDSLIRKGGAIWQILTP